MAPATKNKGAKKKQRMPKGDKGRERADWGGTISKSGEPKGPPVQTRDRKRRWGTWERRHVEPRENDMCEPT